MPPCTRMPRGGCAIAPLTNPVPAPREGLIHRTDSRSRPTDGSKVSIGTGCISEKFARLDNESHLPCFGLLSLDVVEQACEDENSGLPIDHWIQQKRAAGSRQIEQFQKGMQPGRRWNR